MTRLAFTRRGAGAPLVLLHGLGSSRRAFDAVVPALAERFEVLAVDLPGFGDSKPFAPQQEPHPAALAGAVGGLLEELGVDAPHVVGNSLGGWVALEIAHRRAVASLTLLSPAGLWTGNTPRFNRASLRALRWLARHGRPLSPLMNSKVCRTLVLRQTHGRPWKMTGHQARTTIEALAGSPGFDATFAATLDRRYRSGPRIDAPVTVAFGSRDLVLLRQQSRHLDQLPAGTRLQTLPGCGHVPMFDDPTAVTALIVASAATFTPSRSRRAS